MSKLSHEDQQEIIAAIENEGIEYTFRYHFDFEEVKSEEFHVLRKAFVKAANELEEFIYKDYVPPAEEEEEE